MVDRWGALIDAGERLELCRSLAQDHYDPAYEKSMSAVSPVVQQRFETGTLDPVGLGALADRIAEALQKPGQTSEM
ncbi:tRNA 2-selenouridine synthase [Citreicella sp. SE45]|nr:tRNA 2-selenouridine synthase [Citreicella sp. SE45]